MFARGRSNEALLAQAFETVSARRDPLFSDDVGFSTMSPRSGRLVDTLVLLCFVCTRGHTAIQGVAVVLTIMIPR
jgi:hypothetical protein